MYLIYLLLTIGLILVNFAGLTAWVSRYFPVQASARALGMVLPALILFAVEHLHGLGKLNALWPLTTGLAAWSLSKRRDREFREGEAVFLLGFLYGLAWRFAFPNIDGSSEHLTNLYLVSNYLAGQTLPAPDRWLAGSFFDFYYAFQHYGAALLARLFNLEAGLAINMAWALLIALMVSLAWEITGYFVKHSAPRLLLIIALMLGGNGLSPLMPLMIQHDATDAISLRNHAVERMWASTRFAGLYDQQVNTAFGQAVSDDPKQPNVAEHLELPLETIAYLSMTGDYHAPLGSFVIMLWTLALSAFLGMRKFGESVVNARTQIFDSKRADDLALFSIGLTPALVLVTNTWVFPLQLLLVVSWLGFRVWKADVHWPALLLGGAAGLACIYPFLSHFAPNSLNTPIRWVSEADQSPLRFFMAMHWPLMLWLMVGLIVVRRSPWAGWLALSLLAMFCLSEWVYVDDPSEGKYQRFNTTLKWWSWIWPTALIGLGSVGIGLGGRITQLATFLSLSVLLVYTVDTANYWRYIDKPNKGQMAGDGWLKQDPTQRELLAYLKSAPDGLALESIEQGAYSTSTALALFANKPLVLGWPAHVGQWHGNPAFIANRAAEIRAFYRAELPDALSFLHKYQVRTVIWSLADEQRRPDARQILQAQIGADYHWRVFYQNGLEAAGIWERR